MIKVLFITYNLGAGGAEKVFQTLMNNVDRKKFNVACIIVNKVLNNAYLKKDIELHELNYTNVFNASIRIRNIIKKSNPDIVIGTVTPINILLPLIKLSLSRKTAPVFVFRESTVMSCLGKNAGFKNKVALQLLKIAYPMYGMIVCQSRDIKEDFIQNFNVDPSKLHVINNPVDVIHFENGQKIKHSEIQFVTVGRMRPEKGHVRILEALKNFEKIYGCRYQYHIVGDFSSREIERKIKSRVMELGLTDRVIFHGHLDEPMTILKESDVFLQGSYFEGFPNAVLESCSVGVPVVAYDVPGGTREIIKPGFNGYLAEEGDIESYVHKIAEAVNTKFNGIDMMKDIQERFNQEKIVDEYENFFISLTGNK